MTDLLNWINSYFDFIYNYNTASYVFVAFLIVFTVTAVLRITIAMGYRMQYSLVFVNAKPIGGRDKIKDTRSSFLNKIIKDYTKLGEKGVSLYSSRSIVEKHISKMNLLGINFNSLEDFVNAFERSEIVIGLIPTIIFEDYRLPFAMALLIVFVVLRLIAVFFNFDVVKHRLIQETTEYVDREIGQFFTGDISSMFTKFRNEVSNALHYQTNGLSETIKKLGENVSGVMRLSLQELSKSIEVSMDRLAGASKDINGSLEKWQAIVEHSAVAQSEINEAGKSFQLSAEGFTSASGELKTILEGFINGVRENRDLTYEQIAELKLNLQALRETGEPITAVTGALKGQISYIERNQALLELSMQKYELSMQELTSKIGEGLGSIIDYHIQTSYNSLNHRLEENISQIILNNNSLIVRLQQLFDELRQLSLSETQAIIGIKEQMDMNFDSLSERIVPVSIANENSIHVGVSEEN